MTAPLEEVDAALGDAYTLQRVLGEGGMATVYLARDHKHERDVALKVLRSELEGAESAQRFRAEIRTTATLNHPNILPLFDSGMVEGHAYYVMPVVEGESLQDRLHREGTLSPAEAGRIAAAAARALEYAHARGVVHRDVKPSNILLHLGQTMIADFGISLVSGAEQRLTATGLSLGTPHYMSPEQIDESLEPDGRSDQYALGCVLFEMLEGEPPFPQKSAQAVLTAHLAQAPPAVSSTSPEGRELGRIVQRALSKDPAARYVSMAVFAEAIEAAFTSLQGPGRDRRGGLVVLPFANMSGDPNDEYFSDGLTEEVIGDLSRINGLRVISRTSAMQYKETSLRLPQIAEELGVRYALEGGVRKAGDRLRVSAQLIDTTMEEHLWAGVSTDPIHFSKVDEYVERMERLEPGTPFATMFRGLKSVFSNPKEGCLLLVEAVEAGLDDDPDTLWWAGAVLGLMGLPDVGERYIAQLTSIDPKGQTSLFADYVYSAYRGRWAEALRAAEAFPDDLMGGIGKPMLGGWVAGCAGDVAAALAWIETGAEATGEGAWPVMRDMLLRAYRADRAGGLSYSDEELAVAWQDFQYSAMVADAYAQVGAREPALRWLRHAVDVGFYSADFTARMNAHLAGLRGDPDFERIVDDARAGEKAMRATLQPRLGASPGRGA